MLEIKSGPRMGSKFETYPPKVKERLTHLRQLIMEVATESEAITEIEETLKWGEPSCLVKKGSTLRMDWKIKTPDQYAMYFKCTSKLVETFKDVHGDTFNYENSQPILFKVEDEILLAALKTCISATLHYHSVKELPHLGM